MMVHIIELVLIVFQFHSILFHSCTVHLDTIGSFIYTVGAHLDGCGKPKHVGAPLM